jgi:hypothetical protein
LFIRDSLLTATYIACKKFQEIPIAFERTLRAPFGQVASVCYANRQEQRSG